MEATSDNESAVSEEPAEEYVAPSIEFLGTLKDLTAGPSIGVPDAEGGGTPITPWP